MCVCVCARVCVCEVGACVCVCTHAGGNVFALNWFVMFLHSFDLLSFVQSTFFAILGLERERERERGG